jgi:hypothetical protein
MTTSNSPFVDLIEEFPSKELGLLEVECKDALVFACTKAEQVITMNWQPPPHPPTFLKHVPNLFVLLPYITMTRRRILLMDSNPNCNNT